MCWLKACTDNMSLNVGRETGRNRQASTKDVGMLQRILDLQVALNLSNGQLLAIAQEIVGDNFRTIDRLTRDERLVLIAELERLLTIAGPVLV